MTNPWVDIYPERELVECRRCHRDKGISCFTWWNKRTKMVPADSNNGLCEWCLYHREYCVYCMELHVHDDMVHEVYGRDTIYKMGNSK